MLALSETAEKLGFRTRGVQTSFDELIESGAFPCILHWNSSHFVVAKSAKKKFFSGKIVIEVADPSSGITIFDKADFIRYWCNSTDSQGKPLGIALIIEPTAAFFELESEDRRGITWTSITRYLSGRRREIVLVCLTLLISSVLQLVFPFLTQSIVDTGVNSRNIDFVIVVLIAQLTLTVSRSFVDFIRSRTLLYISVRFNLSILSDFWIKVTGLPISYFEVRHAGDTLQRVQDHKKIENFLTGTSLNTAFSLFSFVTLSFLLIAYSFDVYLIFFVGSVLQFFWIRLFLRFRRKLNYKSFHLSSIANEATLQLIQGMQEIKLHNASTKKRWAWEGIQASIFKWNFKSLAYSQIEQAGSLLLNEGKNILITFVVARLVIEGHLTMGALLAIQYLVGQLSGPISQIVDFVQQLQDAKISIERLNEVHNVESEELSLSRSKVTLPSHCSIRFEGVQFAYPGQSGENVLKDLNLNIPSGKVTALVGLSGSGKTTVLKLLLKFFESYSGSITLYEEGSHNQLDDFTSSINFKSVSPAYWRTKCAAVLQDGFIFNESIGRNIVVADDEIDYSRLYDSCRAANIMSFIESLPNGFDTKLGHSGAGLSAGQKQRILIARAIYRSPDFMFFDEATNALDAYNEGIILENLVKVFKGRTILVVAHRLSTVRNADNIVVMENGRAIEQGTHETLIELKGRYYQLVKNQLELGG